MTGGPAAPLAPGSFRLPEAPRPEPDDVPDGPERSPFWRRGFPVLVAALAVLGLVVGRVGLDALLDSTDGKITASETDPAAPGFEAIVEPTPLLAVASEEADGGLGPVALLALSGPDQGGVLVLPPDTVVDDGSAAPTVLRAAHRSGGAEALGEALDRLLGFDVGEPLVLDDADWPVVVGPAAPLTVTFLDDVVVDDGAGPEVRWPAGEVTIEAREVPAVLAARQEGESDLVRMGRVEGLWTAWIAAVADGGPDVVAGERDVGLGRFLLGLADRGAGATTPPMTVSPLPDGGGELFGLDPTGSESLLRSLVPFPRSGFEGQRLRVRVLDGTGTEGLALRAASPLVAAGAEITILGNAGAFDVAATELVYHRADDEARVVALAEALGVGTPVLVEEVDVAVDVTVVLGADAVGIGG